MKNVSVSELKGVIKKLYALAEEGKYMGAMIWGPPGVGKSAAVRQVAEDLSTAKNPVGFIDLRLSLLNPVDLRGLPSVNREERLAEWLAPEFLPNAKSEKHGILFLDEINLAPQSVMAAGYQLILDRRLGDYHMPPGWLIVAAGNRVTDTPTTTKMPAPLANRFIHLQIEQPNFDEWRQWAVKNQIAEQVVSFLSKMPQHLFQAPKIDDKAWPSPRSWEFASNLYHLGEPIDAAVGGGIAAEFNTFLRVYTKIPDIDAILAGKKVSIPKATELDVLWATCMSIVYKATPKDWANVYAFIDQIPKEFEVLVIKLLDEKNAAWKSALVNSSQFKKFCNENPELFGE